jgi:hypothetical protein
MGAPVPQMNPEVDPAQEATTEAFLTSLRTIAPPERRKHASVYNYWLTIRGSRAFPAIHDFDPLEFSDAGAFSVLLEMIGGGEDAEIRHVGQAIGDGSPPDKISEAPNPSLLSCIASRLPIVAACRDALAFEEELEGDPDRAHCWVTLLPFSVTGDRIDFVYGFVSVGTDAAAAEPKPDTGAETESVGGLAEVLELADRLAADSEFVEPPLGEAADNGSAIVDAEPVEPSSSETEAVEPSSAGETESNEAAKPGFSKKFFDTLANVGGFYGRPVEVELDMQTANLESWGPDEAHSSTNSNDEHFPADEPSEKPSPTGDPSVAAEPFAADEPSLEDPSPADEPSSPEETSAPDAPPSPIEASSQEEPQATEPSPKLEGTLESKLSDVRAKADEARQAKLRANAALYEGLSAAYDFALDAEDSPDEYLKLVQSEGLKIQLRAPMKPVAKLAFSEMCDEVTIKQLEAVLAWAFDEELPRGTLAERIEAEGGIAMILNRQAKAA